MHSDDDNPKELTPAEARLEWDRLLGALNYPDPGLSADAYFREGFALICHVNQPDEVRQVLESYLRHGCDGQLRSEIEAFLNANAAQGKEEICGQ